jgi:hypothetical protein
MNMSNNIKSKVTRQSKKRMAIKVDLIKTEIEKIKPSDARAVYYAVSDQWISVGF